MKHYNIPIFIPHLGCPHQCVFCNQRSISGCDRFFEADVEKQIETALSTIPERGNTEIAFFGGSFTGIDRALMLRLLGVAQTYVDGGAVTSIRLSTRPDYIDGDILRILSDFSVRNIELGLQSMDDRVLTASKRGHTAKDAQRACRMIVDAGFSLTGQIMIGLPKSTRESEIMTTKAICDLGATAVRIYPTVVFYQTPLCQMAESGEYTPLTLQEAVERSADVLEIFEDRGVPCIRLGLCATEALVSDDAVYAGPNHPALGELVLSECRYREMVKCIKAQSLLGEKVILKLPANRISQFVGHNRKNIDRLRESCGVTVARILPESNASISVIKA
ncbi:MAG: radical SAM protein [Clostridia bacterium]|nr:radical SAM protein [Clostridia bacterium]